MKKIRSLTARSEAGQTIVEYGLILTFVSVLMIGSLVALQVGVDDYYAKLTGAIKAII